MRLEDSHSVNVSERPSNALVALAYSHTAPMLIDSVLFIGLNHRWLSALNRRFV